MSKIKYGKVRLNPRKVYHEGLTTGNLIQLCQDVEILRLLDNAIHSIRQYQQSGHDHYSSPSIIYKYDTGQLSIQIKEYLRISYYMSQGIVSEGIDFTIRQTKNRCVLQVETERKDFNGSIEILRIVEYHRGSWEDHLKKMLPTALDEIAQRRQTEENTARTNWLARITPLDENSSF